MIRTYKIMVMGINGRVGTARWSAVRGELEEVTVSCVALWRRGRKPWTRSVDP